MTPVPKKVRVKKNGVQFTIERTHESDGETSKSIYRVKVDLSQKFHDNLHIKISKRGILDRTFGFNKGDFPDLNPQIAVKGSNAIIIKQLLTNRYNLQIIYDLLSFTKHIDFNNQTTYKMNRSDSKLLYSLEKTLELVYIIENLLVEVYNDQRYTIEQISSSFLYELSELNCVVCRQEVIPQDLFILDCCGSAAHKLHIQSWLEKDSRCPYCKKKDVKLLAPNNVTTLV